MGKCIMENKQDDIKLMTHIYDLDAKGRQGLIKKWKIARMLSKIQQYKVSEDMGLTDSTRVCLLEHNKDYFSVTFMYEYIKTIKKLIKEKESENG